MDRPGLILVPGGPAGKQSRPQALREAGRWDWSKYWMTGFLKHEEG